MRMGLLFRENVRGARQSRSSSSACACAWAARAQAGRRPGAAGSCRRKGPQSARAPAGPSRGRRHPSCVQMGARRLHAAPPAPAPSPGSAHSQHFSLATLAANGPNLSLSSSVNMVGLKLSRTASTSCRSKLLSCTSNFIQGAAFESRLHRTALNVGQCQQENHTYGQCQTHQA